MGLFAKLREGLTKTRDSLMGRHFKGVGDAPNGFKIRLLIAGFNHGQMAPGEAREADLGVASGNGKGQIFIKGKVIQTVPEDQIVETLLAKAQEIAAQMEADGQLPATATGPVVVPVTQNGNC